MKKSILLLCLSLGLFSLEAAANRTLYVDGFETILGDTDAENRLLEYAAVNEIETLLLYGLHIVNANHNLPNPATNYVLADFISKAKTSYNVSEVGATAENGDFFTNVIDAYNNSRSNPAEKFDIYNLEFEYWIDAATETSGYYCDTYLAPNGIPCDRTGAFQFYVATLQVMDSLATNSTHPITTEAYVGWTIAQEAAVIGANLDRVRVHAYVSDPATSFSYTEDRIMAFADGNPDLDVSIIFSSESAFMRAWLSDNSMLLAENIFTTDWMNASATWTNNVNLTGFTYFAYSHHADIILPVTSLKRNETVSVFPNPVQRTLSFRNVEDAINIKVYNSFGQLVLTSTEEAFSVEHLATGTYACVIETDRGRETMRVMKE